MLSRIEVGGDDRPGFVFTSSPERLYVLESLPFHQLGAPSPIWVRVSAEVPGEMDQTLLSDTNTPPVGGLYRIRVRRP